MALALMVPPDPTLTVPEARKATMPPPAALVYADAVIVPPLLTVTLV